jgi:membrane protease YdiL (CAAX protease family)
MKRHLSIAISVAALLWFYMFSPWTQGQPNFWIVMTFSGLVLTTLAFSFTPDRKELLKVEKPLLQLGAGILIALLLWCVFWVGDKASSALFDFARYQVDGVYAMKTGLQPSVIAVLLLLIIGPAEELFWRGYVQRTMTKLHDPNIAFIVTTIIYALVHIWSGNFMLVMAALTAGAAWGLLYRFFPKSLPALIVSHALWDALVFVIIPI